MRLHPARVLLAAFAAVVASLAFAQGAQAAPSGGSGGPLTDRTFQSYTGPSGVTSRYHVYAAGLDWSREVGLLIYADGSGENGLTSPDSGSLLGGTNGLVAVAKRHNMVLLTPMAPGGDCPDGGGTCWYAASSGITPQEKARWSFELAQYVKSQYRIETDRVAIGGYSSGAQWATEYFAPMFGSQLMTDGVVVPISYGGPPNVTVSLTPQHRATVAYSWDVGERDTAGVRAARAGYDWYTSNGFTTTQLQIVPGEDHSRAGQFGAIMDREITEHVRPALPVGDTSTSPPTPTVTPPSTSPVVVAPAARSGPDYEQARTGQAGGARLVEAGAASADPPNGGCPSGGDWTLVPLKATTPGFDRGNFHDQNGDGYVCRKPHQDGSGTLKDNTNPA